MNRITPNNLILAPRPHHPLVENMEALFLGCIKKYQSPPRRIFIWQTINEWLIIASLCLLLSITLDFIIRI